MSKRKLLLADDSVTIQKVVNLTFADEGIEVITAGDGNSAIEKLREIEPDLVMADVNMPGLNGYEICERIKLDEATRHTPVILLVGSFEPFDEAKAQAVGADDYLTKPFQSIRQLVNKVTDLLLASGENEPEISQDTLEMDKPEFSERSGFEGEAIDDDMIETRQMENYSSFDTPGVKRGVSETAADTDDFLQTETAPAGERDDYRAAEEEIERSEKRYFEGFNQSYTEDIAETPEPVEEDFSPEPVESKEETEDITPADDDYFSSETTPTAEETEQYFEEPEQEMTNYPEENKEELAGEIPQPVYASALELDEFNLLDLPPFDFDETEETTQEFETEPPAEQPQVEEWNETKTAHAAETAQTSVENEVKPEVAAQFSSIDFPPEVIEAIADKVVEKLSKKLKE